MSFTLNTGLTHYERMPPVLLGSLANPAASPNQEGEEHD
jgi:hypothetical protein